MTTSRDCPLYQNLEQISLKFSVEDTEDFKQTFYEAMTLVDPNDYEQDDNFLWRRIIVNMLFMYCLIKERETMQNFGNNSSHQ